MAFEAIFKFDLLRIGKLKGELMKLQSFGFARVKVKQHSLEYRQ